MAPNRGIEPPARTALYRLYGTKDELLYIGITHNPEQRWAWHQDIQTWWPHVTRKTVQWFDDRLTAAKAEARAIRAENPGKNVALPDEDGLGGWTPIPGRRTQHRVRIARFLTTDDLWERFTDAVDRSPDPEADMSKVLRSFVRWYAGESGAELPRRPQPQDGA